MRNRSSQWMTLTIQITHLPLVGGGEGEIELGQPPGLNQLLRELSGGSILRKSPKLPLLRPRSRQVTVGHGMENLICPRNQPNLSRSSVLPLFQRLYPIFDVTNPLKCGIDTQMPSGSKATHQLSVVVPVYNSASILPALLERLGPALSPLARDFEVILVNDGSRDHSWSVVQEMCAKYPWAHGINLMRNYGQHNALLCGIRSARFDTVVTMDDDLQHPPEEIHKLLTRLDEGFEVVYGYPQQEQHGRLRNIASLITKLTLQRSMGAETARHISAFRAFRTQIRNAFAGYHSPFISIDVVLTWGTTRFVAVPVYHNPRQSGASNYTVGMLFRHAMNMMTGFSVLPLQLANLMGFLCTAFGGGVLVYVVGRYLIQGTTVAGFPFLASIISIFSGAQLLALGIIGEYLARMHFRMMERPTYTVREDVSRTNQPSP